MKLTHQEVKAAVTEWLNRRSVKYEEVKIGHVYVSSKTVVKANVPTVSRDPIYFGPVQIGEQVTNLSEATPSEKR